MKNRIFILLGSNIDKENNIQAAVRYLDECCHVMAVSGVYETCPVGLVDQPTFLNAAVLVESELSANQFRKTVLCRLERRLKRTRT
ncbi:MAG TPA: 2-amino-4-hydroxy-6-hydroxymethyldihydropteridine diphosphokinase, partial [candidate division Zixibacteria bacterium]|nr:2-amino-4-hydroxy-6-hydroxymethyldihydropteridine diphosphokinase [candidate division Zixibacteria bacterium]